MDEELYHDIDKIGEIKLIATIRKALAAAGNHADNEDYIKTTQTK